MPFRVHTASELAKLDRITVSGYPCTSGTRTVIDLARLRIASVQLEAAVDSSVRGGWSAPLVIVERLGELRGPGRWGARTLDRLLLDSGGHTMLERRFLELVRLAGLPRPRTQVIFRHGATTFARVDFIWDGVGVVVEVSGSKGHSSPSERGQGRPTSQRAAGHRPQGVRVHLRTRDAAAHLGHRDAQGADPGRLSPQNSRMAPILRTKERPGRQTGLSDSISSAAAVVAMKRRITSSTAATSWADTRSLST